LKAGSSQLSNTVSLDQLTESTVKIAMDQLAWIQSDNNVSDPKTGSTLTSDSSDSDSSEESDSDEVSGLSVDELQVTG
jgi:hypothetical protein